MTTIKHYMNNRWKWDFDRMLFSSIYLTWHSCIFSIQNYVLVIYMYL